MTKIVINGQQSFDQFHSLLAHKLMIKHMLHTYNAKQKKNTPVEIHVASESWAIHVEIFLVYSPCTTILKMDLSLITDLSLIFSHAQRHTHVYITYSLSATPVGTTCTPFDP